MGRLIRSRYYRATRISSEEMPVADNVNRSQSAACTNDPDCRWLLDAEACVCCRRDSHAFQLSFRCVAMFERGNLATSLVCQARLEGFPARRAPVRIKKTRQNKKLARLRLRPTSHVAPRKLDTSTPALVSQAKLEPPFRFNRNEKGSSLGTRRVSWAGLFGQPGGGASPVSSVWAIRLNFSIGPFPAGRSKTNTRS
jgi:hypothetical protein